MGTAKGLPPLRKGALTGATIDVPQTGFVPCSGVWVVARERGPWAGLGAEVLLDGHPERVPLGGLPGDWRPVMPHGASSWGVICPS